MRKLLNVTPFWITLEKDMGMILNGTFAPLMLIRGPSRPPKTKVQDRMLE